MKLSESKTDEELIFHWHNKPEPSPIHIDHSKKRDFEDYFDFLEELPPYPQEVRQVTIFGMVFTL